MTPQIIDLTSKSPGEYRVRTRPASEVRAIVLHQTAFSGWDANNPMWARVRAHFVVRQDDSVLMLHDPLVRMHGSGTCNAQGVTVECEGNLPSDTGAYWKPEKFGRDVLDLRIPVDLGTRSARDLGGRSGPRGRIGAERRDGCARRSVWRVGESVGESV